jgi:hypothetical protein
MKNFNSLNNLIHKLSKEEFKSLIKFLKYYYSRDENAKSIDLVKLLKNSYEIKPIDVQLKLYGSLNNFAFNKLINRLHNKILEVLIFSTNISKKNYTERAQVIFDLKKKLIQCDILSLKGLRDDGDKLCRKIISKAEKYELYDIHMNALLIRQRFVNIRNNDSVIKKIQAQIQISENKQKAVINSQIIYNSIINKINNTSNSDNYSNELRLAVSKIENENKNINSNIILYYLNYLKIELLQIEDNYIEASNYLNLINDLLDKKSIYSENRKGTALLNIANNYLHLNKYEETIKFATNALSYFPNNIVNKSLVNEYLFYANFYSKEYLKSKNVINYLVNLPVSNNILSSMNKWKYLDAVLDFQSSKFDDCVIKLNNLAEVVKDREDWNINKRLLIIMCRIELKQYESVDLQVISLEKYIKRSIKLKNIRFRYIIILRVLIKLINSNYNFQDVLRTRKRYINLLDSKDPEVKWKIKSSELIRVDQWFKSKSELVNYDSFNGLSTLNTHVN